MRNAFIRVAAVNTVKVEDPKLGLKAGDSVLYSKNDIVQTLEEWSQTRSIKYYLIEHNHDKSNNHFHIVIDFPKNSSASFKTIKNKFPYGDIERCRYGVKNCVQYLVHMNDPTKEKYNWSEIVTNAAEKLEDYKVPGTKTESAEYQALIDKILAGEIKQFQLDRVPPHLYIKYRTKIENAFDYYRKVQAAKERNIDVYFLEGPTGLGKSTFCKKWAFENNLSFCPSSPSNDPWQDYLGQDIFAYDDFNPHNIDLEDFMKSINPHISATAKSRYCNKTFIGSTIFIASNIPVLEWFFLVEKSRRDAFFRRIKKVIRFSKNPNQAGVSDIKIYHFNESYTDLVFEREATFNYQEFIDTHCCISVDQFDSQLNKIVNF